MVFLRNNDDNAVKNNVPRKMLLRGTSKMGLTDNFVACSKSRIKHLIDLYPSG